MSTATIPAPTAGPTAGGPDPAGGGTAAWRVVAEREVRVKLRDKPFLVSFAVLVLLVVVGIVLSAVLGGRPSTSEVAVVGQDARATAVVGSAREQLPPGDRLEVREVADAAAAEQLVAAGDVDAALLEGPGEGLELVGDEEVDGGLAALLAQGAEDEALERGAAAAGTSAEELLAGSQLDQRLLAPSDVDPVLATLLPLAFGFLFYLLAIQFGLAIAQSVVEEKQSRVVEILAAAVPLRSLLVGKVVANGALALAQVAVLVAVGLAGLAATGRADLLGQVGAPALWFVAFFVLGFVALACIWAVAGSVATRTEDLQSTTAPLLVVLVAVLYVGVYAGGWLLVVASYVPVASTVAMPARLVTGGVAWWEPVVSVALVLVAAALLVRLGAALYERSLLRTDRRTSVRELLRERG
ncbi:ABC transporter permease [uncultured Pseudokineococcus sp.]|uniref:ABC transporter permease n=1 Tax=uncultured Pseudokineococcus sp. TaxID=1642928 RepID=UPI0026229326|nr:ABC transporter permease [uncultured Pseudokineococcus sp.]